MHKLYIIFTLFLIGLIPLRAGSFKKYAGEFQNLGIGGRALAMGGAGTAIADNVTAAYWNPAGLVRAKGFQAEFMHSKQFISSIQQNYLGFSSEYDENSTIALSLIYLTVGGIKDSRNAWDEVLDKPDYSRIRTFSTGDYSLLISYGRRWNDKLDIGVNVKTIYRDYDVESAFGLGVDAGVQYHPWRNLMLGALLRDITTTMISWSTGEREFITPSMRLGASYRFDVPAIDLYVQPAADINILFEGREYAAQAHVGPASLDGLYGLEVGYRNIIAVRAGLDDLSRFTTGVGLQIPVIRFDYSFTAFASELGDIHRISFHLDFDKLF